MQQNQQSKRIEIDRQTKKKQNLIDRLNGIPKRIENLLIQHQNYYISTENLKELINEVEEKKIRYRKRLAEVEESYSFKINVQQYAKSLEQLRLLNLENLRKSNNREELQRILRTVIQSIAVHSRPLTDKDVISGRKSTNQMIPYKIEMKLKLPKEYLEQLKVDILKNAKPHKPLSLVPPDELSDEEINKTGISRKDYTKNYQNQTTDFGNKKDIW